MGKSIISMAIFNSYFDITRGYCTVLYPCSFRPHRHSLRSNLLPLSPGAWTGYLVWLGKSSPETMVFTMKKWGGSVNFPFLPIQWLYGLKQQRADGHNHNYQCLQSLPIRILGMLYYIWLWSHEGVQCISHLAEDVETTEPWTSLHSTLHLKLLNP